MAVLAGPALAAIHCILAQAVTVTASDRTEVRTRVQSSVLRFDAETRPQLRLAMNTPHASYSFGYIPTLTWLSIAVPDEGELIMQQTGDINFGYRWEHTNIYISESGAYGTRNFRALSVAAPTPTGPPTGTNPPTGTTPPGTTPPGGMTPPPGGTGTTPPGGTGTMPPGTTQTPPGLSTAQYQLVDQNITLANSQTRLALQQIFSTRTIGTVGAGYEYGGGIGAQSELFLPIRKGPSATLSLRHRTSLTDDFTTVTNGTTIETGSNMRAWIVDLGEQWTHRWSPAFTASLLVGAAAARTERDGLPERRTSALVPVATVNLDHGFGVSGGRFRTVGFLQLAPVVDRFTGDFDQRLQWMVDASWTRFRLSLIANFTGAQSVLPRVAFTNPTLLPFNYYSASASVLYRFTRQLSVEGGLRTAYVRTEGPDPYPLLWSIFAAGTYTLGATYL